MTASTGSDSFAGRDSRSIYNGFGLRRRSRKYSQDDCCRETGVTTGPFWTRVYHPLYRNGTTALDRQTSSSSVAPLQM
jgi:hypothetical protein